MTEAFERALSHAQRTGEARELAAINRGLVRAALAGPMQADPAIAHCEELLERAPGDRTLRAMVAGAVGVLRAMRGEFEEARESGAWAVALFEELGKPVLAGAMRCWAAEVELYAGEPEQAERILAPAYELLEARGETGILASVAAYLAQAALARGALEEAERLTRTSARSASVDDVHAQVAWRVVRARVRSRLGQLGEAEAVGRAACTLAAETDYANLVGDAFSCLGAVLLAGGRADEAASELERALAAYEAKGNEVAAAAVRSELERLGGTTSVASGGSDASPSSESLTGRTTGPPIG
jgi:tetratricopeptide (TPR) repeat protein